jgi:hypothetical protein
MLAVLLTYPHDILAEVQFLDSFRKFMLWTMLGLIGGSNVGLEGVECILPTRLTG